MFPWNWLLSIMHCEFPSCREDWAKKFRHWKDKFKSAMQHYWLGTKLLWADARISSRLLLKLASGKGLSRREIQKLTRTTADIFWLDPFAVFIIVPFMEFLLPVFLRLFPNMLPSTFQDKMKEQVKIVIIVPKYHQTSLISNSKLVKQINFFWSLQSLSFIFYS